ncbi:hypothetical protein SUGI_1056830 [Cryptomeria japonica]|uniref:uncharacterized protein LOC131060779 n=1 Tax=Cryptomeria japonica TaxID=3369 RepID=UPI0024146E95|nr:uncharacterized protein LOC131060779 [Cryptomeria japonica]GLJ49768.1 hypothetical protein SUGI_1056830 [Cryptomeria japonica]
MDNNGCGFQISQIEDDFTSRNSITSLLDQAGSGTGQAGGGGAIHHSFFDPLASYLENINPRNQQQQQQGLLIRKASQGLGDPQAADNNSINGSNATSADRVLPAGGAPEYSNGSMEHFDAASASASHWQHHGNSSSRVGGGGGAGGSSASNGGTSGRLSVEQAGGASKAGKKRSRASRRAPTTVLTTDTSNFRAMVQEFTGIPPAPFASASPFPRARLDFLGGPRGLGNPFLLRPFPQRMAAGPGALSFPPSTNPNLQSFPQNPLFQSLLHPGGGGNLVHKSGGAPLSNIADAQMKAGLLEELGLNAHALPDLVPWHAGQDNAAACKMSYSKSAGAGDPSRSRTLNLDEAIANASDHHNNNHGRPDRMVDSWISSSDQTLDKLVQ